MIKNLLLIAYITLLLIPHGVSAKQESENIMKIQITISEGEILEAQLNSSSASKSLLEKLPLSINMSNHENREYYATLKLEKNDEPQNGYQIGDIAYWTPGDCFVIYYNKGYTGSIIKMGKIISGIEKLASMKKSINITIEK